MRKFIFLAFVILVTACGPNLQEKTIESYPDGTHKRVQFTSGEGETAYVAKEVFYYQNGQKKLEGTYNKDGKKNGKWIYWREDGKIWSEGYFAEGRQQDRRARRALLQEAAPSEEQRPRGQSGCAVG